MQTISKELKVVEVDTSDEDYVMTTYECDVVATLAHDSIWDCVITAADEVRIKTICVNEGVDGGNMDGYVSINVFYTVNGKEEYEDSWTMYTDTGFEATVSDLLGYSVSFTEQGMQDDGMASMEC